MDIPVKLPGMEGQNLALRTAGTFSGAKLMLNGEPVAKQNGCFNLRSNAGSTLAVKFKARFLDPIPNLVVGGPAVVSVPLDEPSHRLGVRRRSDRRAVRRLSCRSQQPDLPQRPH